MRQNRAKKLLLIFLASMFLTHALVFWAQRERLRAGYQDFTIFYAAGKMVRQRLAHRLYDIGLQFRVQNEFAPGVLTRQGPLPYNHPPFEALLFAPLASLPYLRAYLIWDFINLAILGALPLMLRPYVPLLQRTSPVFWFFAGLSFFPVFVVLLQGQDTIVLLLLFSLAFVAFRKKSEFIAGCWLGLGMFRFQLVLPLVLVLVLRRRWKAVAGFAAVVSILGLISVALVGWQAAMAYPAFVWSAEKTVGGGAGITNAMPNLHGLLGAIGSLRNQPVLMNVLVGIFSFTLLFYAAAMWNLKDAEERFDFGFALAIVVSILVSYHALAHDLVLLWLPVLLVANRLFTKGMPGGRVPLTLAGPAFVLFCSPLLMILWFRYDLFNLTFIALMVWVLGIGREISKPQQYAITGESA